jgi:hypothetical protein
LLAKLAFFVFNPCLLLAKEACLFEAFLLILIKIIIKTRHEQRLKNKNASFAPPLACKGSIFVFLTFARASQEAGVKNKNASFASKGRRKGR